MFRLFDDNEVLIQLRGEQSSPLNFDSSTINLLIWNVFKGQRKTFGQDFKRLIEGKDFVFLQEAMLDHAMPDLLKSQLQHEWHIAQSFQYSKSKHATGVGIGSIVSPENVSFLRPVHRELFWLTPKMSIFNEFTLNQTTALFVNTHVLNFVTTKMFIHSLEGIAKKISDFPGPVVLAGDFNTWNATRLLAMKDIFANLKLEHVVLDQDSRLLRLDHVFVRGFDIQFARVLNTIQSSDHYPLEITLTLGR